MPEAVEFHWEKRRIYRGAVILLAIGFPGVLLATMEGVDAKSLGLAWTAGFVALAAGRPCPRQAAGAVDRAGALVTTWISGGDDQHKLARCQ